MIAVTSVENMRQSDKMTIETKISSKELMYRAGLGIFESVDWHGEILVAAGTGNNAGDGYVLAELLKDKGYSVSLLLLENKFSDDGRYYFDRCICKKVPWSVYNLQKLQGYDIIVDCIFGTGFKGEPQGAAKVLIDSINESGAYVVSADINSGMNGDSGIGVGCVKSQLTVSIGSYKYGHFLNQAKDKIGKLVNVDIGIDLIDTSCHILEENDVKKLLFPRDNYSNKGTYGYITIIGGCAEYSGAVKLANLAASAMRAGCGVVKLAVPKSICSSVAPYLLESTLYPLDDKDGDVVFSEKQIQGALNNTKALAIGMGWGQKGENEKILRYVLTSYEHPVIIDADGLNTLAKMGSDAVKGAKCPLVLTPHLKEFERLCGVEIAEIQKAPVFFAREYAKKTGVILLLKGPTTIITDGEQVVLSTRGTAGMATAGSGDVLSGILCALCARCDNNLLEAVSVGAYINGYAGEIAAVEYGDISMVASDTVSSIPKAIKKLR